MTLLLVNDIVLEADTMAAEIPWAEYRIAKVFTAYTAGQAKTVIQAEAVDILLCDIEMPGESGLELVRWINDSGYDIDSILLTCHANFAYAKEGISLGCQDYLLLPAKYESIGESVRKVCERRARRQEEQRLQRYGQSWLNAQAETDKSESPAPHRPDEIADECERYILEHIHDENLSVTDVAAHVYLNPMYLNRIFRKEKGMNLSRWITKERMELASTLMKTTGHTAMEIAARVGYNNYPYFSTVFKAYFGCAPSQYER